MYRDFFFLFSLFCIEKMPLIRKIGTSALGNDRAVKSKFVMQSLSHAEAVFPNHNYQMGEFGDAIVALFLQYLDVSQIPVIECRLKGVSKPSASLCHYPLYFYGQCLLLLLDG